MLVRGQVQIVFRRQSSPQIQLRASDFVALARVVQLCLSNRALVSIEQWDFDRYAGGRGCLAIDAVITGTARNHDIRNPFHALTANRDTVFVQFRIRGQKLWAAFQNSLVGFVKIDQGSIRRQRAFDDGIRTIQTHDCREFNALSPQIVFRFQNMQPMSLQQGDGAVSIGFVGLAEVIHFANRQQMIFGRLQQFAFQIQNLHRGQRLHKVNANVIADSKLLSNRKMLSYLCSMLVLVATQVKFSRCDQSLFEFKALPLTGGPFQTDLFPHIRQHRIGIQPGLHRTREFRVNVPLSLPKRGIVLRGQSQQFVKRVDLRQLARFATRLIPCWSRKYGSRRRLGKRAATVRWSLGNVERVCCRFMLMM